MASNKIIKIKDFKLENVRISTPRANKHGGKVAYINYDFEDGSNPKPLRIQLEKMRVPFGVSSWVSADQKNSGPTEMSNDSLDLAFNDSQTDVIKKFEDFENLIIQEGIKNSFEFFKKKQSPEAVKLLFKSNVKYGVDDKGERDTKYPPRLKTKLLKDKQASYIAQVYDTSNKRVEFNIHNHSEIIPKGSEALSIVESGSIWIINGNFGISWRPAQLKIFKNDMALTECAFGDEEETTVSETLPDKTTVSEPQETEETEELEESIESLDLLDSESDPDTPPVVVKTTNKRKTKKA
jgi:hypothetical protein